MKIYRYNTYENRSFEMELDPSTVESIRESKARSVSCIIRTKSGDEILSTDEYTRIVRLWKEATCLS